MTQVDPDSRPGGGPAAHGIDQHVIDSQQNGDLGVLALPSLKASEGSRLIGRIRNDDEGHLCPRLRSSFRPRWRDARPFCLHLAKVWGPWRVGETGGLIFGCEFQ